MIDKEEPIELLGVFVKKNRLAKNLTQQVLAYEAGTQQSTINMIENGKLNPVWSTVYNIFRVLGVLPTEFEDNDVSLKKV